MSQNIILGIAGRKGSGKSSAFQRLLERCPRLFIWDPMGEHLWVPNRFARMGAVEQFLAWADTQEKFAGSYIPSREIAAYFERLANLAYAHGRMVLAVEEIPLLCEPGFLPEGFDMAVRTGRHRRLSIVYTAQRLGEAARRLTAASDYFLLFGCSEPRDLAAIADRCGSDVAEKVGPPGASRLPGLGVGCGASGDIAGSPRRRPGGHSGKCSGPGSKPSRGGRPVSRSPGRFYESEWIFSKYRK